MAPKSARVLLRENCADAALEWVWISLGAGLPGQGFEPVSEGEMTSHKETPSSLVFPASLRRWTRRIQANVALSLVTIPVSCCLRGRSRPSRIERRRGFFNDSTPATY